MKYDEVIARFKAAVGAAHDSDCNEQELKQAVEEVCRPRDEDASA